VKIFLKNLRIFFDFFPVIDTAGSLMFKATVVSIILINNKTDYVSHIEDV